MPRAVEFELDLGQSQTNGRFISFKNKHIDSFLIDPGTCATHRLTICPVCQSRTLEIIWSRKYEFEFVACTNGCVYHANPDDKCCFKPKVAKKARRTKF